MRFSPCQWPSAGAALSRRRAIFTMSLAALGACDREAPRTRSEAPLPPAVALADAAVQVVVTSRDDEGVRFDCSSFIPSSGSGCATQPQIEPAATALVGAVSRLLEYQADHRPSEARWSTLRAAIDGAAKLRVEKLSLEQRVVLQNAALRIAIYAGREDAALARAALALVDRLAPAANALLALGDAPRLEGWLGPPSTWRHRDRRVVVGFHGQFNQNAKYFRPVLAGTRRAVFSQLIAIDTEGAPHLTPLVGEIEMRAGDDPASVACVVELDLAELACNPPGLVAADVATHPHTHFFRRVSGNEVACNSCHTASTFPLVPQAEAAALVATEIEAALATAKQSLAGARAAAAAP